MAPLSVRGQRLADRYELERELSADSQAREWLAHDTALDRRVVLRLLRPELARDAAAAEQFWQVARAAASTNRVGEPRILDGGTDEATGHVFVVREWRDDEPDVTSFDGHPPERDQPRGTFGVTAPVTPDVTPPARTNVKPSATGRVTPDETARVTPDVTSPANATVTPSATRRVTPDETAHVTPDVTPSARPDVTPSATRRVTPDETARVTPDMTPPLNASVTRRVTPERSAGVRRDEAAGVSPGGTSGVMAGVTPGVTPGVTARPYAGGRRRGMAGPAAVRGTDAVRDAEAADATNSDSIAARIAAAARGSRWRTGARAPSSWPVAPRHVVVLGVVIAVVAVAGALVGMGAGAWLAWVNEPLGRPSQALTLAPPVGAQAGQATSVAQTTPPTLAPAAARQQPADATPMPTPTDAAAAGGESRQIANTDGLGVALRTAPGGDRQPGRGYAEGAVVTVFEQQGEWARIRGADGREGWVLAVTLAPTDGAQPVATPARPATPGAAATIGPATPAPRGASTQAPVSTPPATAGGRQRVVNTDGQGVALRAGPDGERLPGKGYDEGTTVSVLEQSGPWTHIRGDDGRDGWVPTVTLASS